MFGAMKNGASAYAKIGVETGVTAASPHKLITMLFDGAMVSLNSAATHMQAGDMAAKGQAISRVISIIENGLRASLDKSAGGELALQLDALYSYMTTRLLSANLNNQADLLTEVHNLLIELRGAWEAIEPKTVSAPAEAAPMPSSRSQYDPFAPAAPQRLVKA